MTVGLFSPALPQWMDATAPRERRPLYLPRREPSATGRNRVALRATVPDERSLRQGWPRCETFTFAAQVA